MLLNNFKMLRRFSQFNRAFRNVINHSTSHWIFRFVEKCVWTFVSSYIVRQSVYWLLAVERHQKALIKLRQRRLNKDDDDEALTSINFAISNAPMTQVNTRRPSEITSLLMILAQQTRLRTGIIDRKQLTCARKLIRQVYINNKIWLSALDVSRKLVNCHRNH